MIKQINKLIGRVILCELVWQRLGMWSAEDEAWAESTLDKLSKMKSDYLDEWGIK